MTRAPNKAVTTIKATTARTPVEVTAQTRPARAHRKEIRVVTILAINTGSSPQAARAGSLFGPVDGDSGSAGRTTAHTTADEH